jgi:hypothetical protein
MHAQDLNLPEQLLLLALEDQRGTLSWRAATFFEYALAGAILTELHLGGAIAVGAEGKVAAVPGAAAPASPVLAEALRQVAAEPDLAVSAWVAALSFMPNLVHRVAEELVAKNVLEHHTGKVLFLFHRTTYPTCDLTPEKELVAQLARVIGGEAPADPRLEALLGLAWAADVLVPHVKPSDIAAAEARIVEVARRNPVVAGTLDALSEARRATFVASSVPFLP